MTGRKRENFKEAERRQAMVDLSSVGPGGDHNYGRRIDETRHPIRKSKMMKGDWLALAGLVSFLGFIVFNSYWK